MYYQAMICAKCKETDHEKCRGWKWCDCQHKYNGGTPIADVNLITTHLAEHCQDKNCKAHQAQGQK